MTQIDHILNDHEKLVIVMVGLPARGKSYIARKLSRYLNWLHIDTKIYNVGNRRRGRLAKDLEGSFSPHPAQFFDPDNIGAKAVREQVAMETLDTLLDSIIHGDGTVAILDATNSSRERRTLVRNHIRHRGGPDLPVLFIESQCSNEQVSSQKS
jgi:6-phosphofructo-2-kinase